MGKQVTVEVAPGEQVVCSCPERVAIHMGDRCLFEQAGLTESGAIIADADVPDDGDSSALPVILRCETLQDQARMRENTLLAQMAEEACRKHLAGLKLEMRLVRVRYSYDRKLLLVVFAADERVDFRELVKLLAGEFHCRIELRQIGVRDEAKLIGGFGPCGREQCCTGWIRRFESVNVRMARTQNLSLNPQGISGMCGRLKCCLRYEDDQYQDALRGLPREGSRVEGPDGEGRVVELQVLRQKVRVRLEDGRMLSYDAEDLRMLSNRKRCMQYERHMQEGDAI
ncbi:MAG: PSP1 domain-containing protein [Kiritimatiellia bacterium]